jgi:exopolyphosphatase/guanosine-5'-triphosphate,3'-diphosphate pyrophosphatase
LRIASLDIGTNSVLLLIADIENSKIIPIREEISIPQLGADFIDNQLISKISLHRTQKVLINLLHIIDHYNADVVLANGTEVFRRAKNSAEAIEVLSKSLGSPINIISSKREAYLSFLGVVPDNNLWTVIDIGGGSTEIITGTEIKIHNSISLPIGSIVIKKQFFKRAKPIQKEFLEAKKYICDIINAQEFDFSNKNLIGIGGTITTHEMIALELKEFNPVEIHNYIFKYEKNLDQTIMLSQKSSNEISSKLNIHPKRADVLFPGELIFLFLQEKFGKADFKISSKGLRYGAIKEFIMKNF